MEVRPPRILDSSIPMELERICLKALSKKLLDRYSTALDFSDDLRCFCSEQTAKSTRSTKPEEEKGRVIPKGLRGFNRDDADLFLKLVPGLRARNNLPETVHRWKIRIEATRLEDSFRVALLYGPSGCGKSSLAMAGILPNLKPDVVPIVVDCAIGDPQGAILNQLNSTWPELENETNLAEAMNALRHRTQANSQVVLIVLDQFEQWLHTQTNDFDISLVDALRQCDGCCVKCLLLVRDEFWLAVSRFLDALDVQLIDGRNTAFVDFFDQRHATKVLKEFGRAYECLPDDLSDLSEEEDLFVEKVIQELSVNSRVVPVRLSIVADMLKGKSWKPQTLLDFHGTDGVGVTFLDETLSVSANPQNRRHRVAVQRVLASLLPPTARKIRGQRRSAEELKRISGYENSPKDFSQLLRLLDHETKLISPVDTYTESREGEKEGIENGQTRYYQLTHDYLVGPLRVWLKKTRQGRARINLEERANLWAVQKNIRALPSLAETIRFLCLTNRKDWTDTQRGMMKSAQIRLVTVLGTVGLVFSILFLFLHRQRQVVAQTLVDEMIESTDIANASYLLERMIPVRREAEAILREQSMTNSRAHLALLWLGDSERHWETLIHEVADPRELDLILNVFKRQKGFRNRVQPDLAKSRLQNTEGGHSHLDVLKDAVTVVQFSKTQGRENGIPNPKQVVNALFAPDIINANDWCRLLASARGSLSEIVKERAASPHRDEQFRAVEILASLTPRDESAELIETLLAVEPYLLETLYRHIEPGLLAEKKTMRSKASRNPMLTRLTAELLAVTEAREHDDATLRKAANAGVVLLRVNHCERLGDCLEHNARFREIFVEHARQTWLTYSSVIQFFRGYLNPDHQGEENGLAVATMLQAFVGQDPRSYQSDKQTNLMSAFQKMAVDFADYQHVVEAYADLLQTEWGSINTGDSTDQTGDNN